MLNDITVDTIGTDPSTTAPVADTTVTESDTATNETEQKLATEISELWTIHTDAQSVVKKTQQELTNIRQRLGENLFQMKQILAKPGRAGQWSSFLAAHQISRTTADRLVAAHQKSLTPDANGTDGSIRELSDEEIAELAKGVWKKLSNKLGSKHAVYTFLGHLVAESGLGSFKFTRGDQHGLALVDPDAVSTQQTTAATSAAPDPMPTNAA